MRPDSVICWLWKKHRMGRTDFRAEHVNALRAMVQRHYPHPHRFICVTAEAEGIDRRVEVILDWQDFADVPSPHGGKNPSCYRRLRMYHPDAAQWFGQRFVSLDLDAVIVRDLTPIWDRPEDFVIWGDKTNPKTPFNGSMQLLTAGTRSRAWTEFHPVISPPRALKAGYYGSDQGWLSYLFKDKAATWTRVDGVYSFRNHLKRVTKQLPADARICFFHGEDKPWGPGMAEHYPWIGQHYHANERWAAAS